ncbi:hypoxanthine phosphoribosyltransferase [Thermosipho melanesiensis]|uniref:Hypoxanthine phosphoribosyltransferase n=2 Tax=Thermosipho melanesiensis TaxID=46541 RepID=A6LNA4_THEM4|nr:hypoxanthine phosphoribosyltransferase [Thermosipho melanesiensis]ABR31405.1 hypoxanthine phosphoribosyltransferase [Thermosipho melanesiensis BI429]APT74464.1 hypoxanthine phosphoribosyltransferase [Thermosipho melanesiensis]OOC36424.1 hypoxanthine phosphoribosyltransferase [Thermosipho melanesiensis]OOC37242.1 hypoxanthine phosphoribosyltransferase [Thermosipho melanesiensis]OOC37994.1 hypoxanthine phosphoribosyltransferase [Thermosipho melanesiensis]
MDLKVLIDKEKLARRIKEMGREITEYYKGKTETIHTVCVLKGAIHFFSDLVENIDLNVEYSFIHVSSYSGMESTGRIRVKSWIDEPIEGKHVLVVEDILDTGQTLSYILGYLKRYNPKDLKVATLLKKSSKKPLVGADFIGFDIEDKFVVGYGLDFDEKFRNIPYIGYME